MIHLCGKKFLVLWFAVLHYKVLCDKIHEIKITQQKHRHNRITNINAKILFDKSLWEPNNFVITDFLSDGEIERRLKFNNIILKETKVKSENMFLKLLQVSDQREVFQLIFIDENEIVECDHRKHRKQATEFVHSFYDELGELLGKNSSTSENSAKVHLSKHEFRSFIENGYFDTDLNDFYQTSFQVNKEFDAFVLKNLTYTLLNSPENFPQDLFPWTNLKAIKKACNYLHSKVSEAAELFQSNDVFHEQESRQKRALADWFLAPNTKWCGNGNQAEKYNDLGGFSRTDMCCRKHDHCKFAIKAMTTKWNVFNYRPYTLSHCSCDLRKKRDLSNLLRPHFPGTKWCGAGWSAKKYADIGGLSKADRCCRQHDTACPYWILSMETKYGLFNWRVGSLLHCSCDARFRTCLKLADSPDANMVGRVFFNVLQTKCFVLKPEKVCKRRSSRGNCEKKGLRKRAHVRPNRRY